MSDLVLRLRAEPRFRLDLSPLTPEGLAGQSADAVSRLPLTYGRRSVPVGEWFDVRGAGGPRLVIEGDGSRLDRIGAAMRDGLIRIEGNAGAYLGIGMRGGQIEVSGDTDAYAASGLAGGLVRIRGDAADFLGAALPGEHRGMRGGVVIVGGRLGDRAADHMRRGTLLFAGPAPAPGPTFNDAGELPLGFLVLLARSWKELPSRFASLSRPSTRVRRWVGDLAFGGQGELIHWPG